ncbi:MAG: CDP-diacylglycerol--glycerol-3-phosphate 3-phosphatidyltransferase [Rhodospirillales bacterium]|nr:MAG: CDP-diacylglycerol--glycerol-3-phosphate 3-phosphatidyltransferase [Rhodospirillales bacterium]
MSGNLPNLLTVSRVLATPVVCVLLMLQTPWGSWLALLVFVLAGITDFLDGYLARAWSQQSSFGRFLDPIADKLLVASVLLVLVGIDRLQGVHILPAAVILWREILVSGLREHLAQLNVGVPVTRLAKWKTTLQMVAIGFLVVGEYGPALGPLTTPVIGLYGLWAAALLTFITGYDYLRAGMGHMGEEPTAAPHNGPDRPEAVRRLERADPARDVG